MYGIAPASIMVGRYSWAILEQQTSTRGVDAAHKIKLVRAGICFGNEDLDCKDDADDGSQSDCGHSNKGNLEQLASDFLPLGEMMPLNAVFVSDDFFPLKLWPVNFGLVDAANLPAYAQVDFLDLPVLGKDGAPDAGEDCIGQ